jgi:hypothetical protein
MLIHIINESKIADIQRQFTACFPYLKLQFSSQLISQGQSQVRRLMLPQDTLIRHITQKEFPFAISIDGAMTIADLEQCFEKETGMHVQVFRSSGKLWLITNATDQWTLNKQNSEGEELSKRASETNTPLDIHEQE